MSLEWRRKYDYEEVGATESRGFGIVLQRGFEVISSLTGSKAKKVERGVLSALSAAAAGALEARKSGGKTSGKDFLRATISNLPLEHFPGIKNLQESDPGTIEDLANELFAIAGTEDGEEREFKIREVIERYEIIGNAGEEVRQLLNSASGFGGTGGGEVSAEDLERFRGMAREASTSKGGAKEKLWSGGGFILKFLFLINAAVIFGLYKLSKLALAKGAGVKSKKQK